MQKQHTGFETRIRHPLSDNGIMTIATPERYAEMLDAARRGGYAYPAINVTSTQTLNAALQGLADAESDGIIQVSVGGSAYFSGQRVNDRVTGSLAFAAFSGSSGNARH